MNLESAKLTKLPPYWRGVTLNHRGKFDAVEPYFFDTETCEGEVYTLFFQERKKKTKVFYGRDLNYLNLFFEEVKTALSKETLPVFCAHRLRFDLEVLFWDILKPLNKVRRAPQHSHFTYLPYKATVKIFWGRPCFGEIVIDGRKCRLIDTMSFFPMSLGAAIEAVGGKYEKKPKPKGLGTKFLSEKIIIDYGLNDVRGGMEVLEEILKLHIKYDLQICVSLPQVASRIFRHKFLKKDFTRPSPILQVMSLLSYHGGKNSFPAKKVGWYKGVTDLDIKSAYPFAMKNLPDFENGKWVKTDKLEEHGIYKVEGLIKPCKWGCLFSPDFKKLSGKIKTYATSYEIKAGIELDHLKINKLSGYYFKEKKTQEKTALTRYVEYFYQKKEEEKNKGQKTLYKMLLNSLYGKFIQRNEDEETGDMIAGAMFDPSVASLITGFTRAQIHYLEHRYDAIHTATDGIITKKEIDPCDLGSELGKLEIKSKGDAFIVRNKLYSIFNSKTGELIKFAAHGFLGSISELMDLTAKKEKIYEASRMSSWREAWHTLERPGVMRKIKTILNY